MSEQTTALAPAKKGNPNLKPGPGRPVDAIRHLARKIRDYDEDQKTPIFQVLFGIMLDPEARNADRIHAAEVLLNRGWGKQVETVLLTDNPQAEERQQLREYSLEELMELRRAAREREASEDIEAEVREIGPNE